MAKQYIKAFYNSETWKRCRDSYMRSRAYLCERCGEPAEIVHHKTYINPNNCTNPEILTDWNNLEALCLKCHNEEHFKKVEKRYKVDKNGRPIIMSPRF